MVETILDLLKEKKYGRMKSLLVEMNPADISQLFGELPEEGLPILFRLLPKELAAETFVFLDGDRQEALIKSFSDFELREVFEELFLDDTVDIIDEMPANVVKRILRNTDIETRKKINELLNYPEDSAGSIMTIEYVDLKRKLTVSSAFERIRETGTDKETIYTCYVTDENRKLQGVVTAKSLLLSDPNSLLEEIMETKVIYANTLDDREEVVKLFTKYDLLAVPVVDKENRLVGIITVDDAIDVIEEETSEDFAKMAAVTPSEESYFKTSVFRHAGNRIIWLLILMLSATLTGIIITNYENAFQAVPTLIAYLPMLMNTGGNCGSQSSTMIIRGMATDEIRLKDFFKALFKEQRISLLVGVILSIVNAVSVFILHHNDPQVLQLTIVLSITIFCIALIAKTLGCCLPMLAKKLRLDPAIMASPIITTIVDCCAVLIYFNIAVAIMNI